MRCAYADPPYMGRLSARHYGGAQVNHRLLITYLMDEFPDGWALSCSSPSLREILPLCPSDARIGAWVKPYVSFKPHVRPAYAWEPLIFRGGRNRGHNGHATPRDWFSGNATIERGTAGAKPLGFGFWLFDILNLQPGDELVDLFPGSGAIGEAWRRHADRLDFEAPA